VNDDLGVWQEGQDLRFDLVGDGMCPGERQVVLELEMQLNEPQAARTPGAKVMNPEHVWMRFRDR